MINFEKNLVLRVFMFVLISFGIFSSSHAADTDPIGGRLCTIVKALQGNTMRAVAIVAIMFLAVQVVMGRMNVWTATTLVVGIFMIFATSTLLPFFTGMSSADCTSASGA